MMNDDHHNLWSVDDFAMVMMTVTVLMMVLVQVRENSKEALGWLKDKPRNTKCVTSKGEQFDIRYPATSLGNLLPHFGVLSKAKSSISKSILYCPKLYPQEPCCPTLECSLKKIAVMDRKMMTGSFPAVSGLIFLKLFARTALLCYLHAFLFTV